MERESLTFLKKLVDYVRRIEDSRLLYADEHPYAILEGEQVLDESEQSSDSVLVAYTSDISEITEVDLENVFSLFGDIDKIYYDDRFKKRNYYIIKFADDEGKKELFDFIENENRSVIVKKKILKIYKMRKEPINR